MHNPSTFKLDGLAVCVHLDRSGFRKQLKKAEVTPVDLIGMKRVQNLLLTVPTSKVEEYAQN